MRRTSSLAALAVAFAVNGGATLPATAGPACVTHVDATGDAKLEANGNKVDADDDLDITGLTLNNTTSELVATIAVKKLAANPAKWPGHGFSFGYTFAGKKFVHSYYKYGHAAADTAAATGEITYSSTVAGTSRPIPVTGAFDLAKSTVTLKVKLADLEPWSFVPAFDAVLTDLNAAASADYLADAETYDTLAAPTASYRIRYGCGPDAVDLGNPPARPVTAAPDTAPRAGCLFAADKRSDGAPIVAEPAAAPNETGLDVLGFNVNTTATHLKAYVQVDKLGDKPANFTGDRYEFVFGYEGKTYTLAVGRSQAPFNTAPFADPNRGQLNGTTNAALKPAGVFDKATNTVVISIARSALEGVHGGAIPLGAIFTGVQVKTWGTQPGLQFPADTATNPADTKYTVGYSPCFLPPAATLDLLSVPSVQFSDIVTLGAKLTREDGAALSGKRVTFTLGGRSESVLTNSGGVATAKLENTLPAGTGSYSVSWAGDPSAGPAAAAGTFTSKLEGTKLKLSVSKSGTSRTVTATLTDDDGKALAGQPVTWTVNGKSAGTAKTDSLGRVILRTAKPTQSVGARFAGVSGRYAAAVATAKV